MIRLFWLFWAALLFSTPHACTPPVANAPPPRDNELDQLRAVRLPHIFSPAEISLMNNQLDILKLGISLFLSQERQLSPQDQQMAFANAWPILRCLFDKDFETPCDVAARQFQQQQMPQAPVQPMQSPPLQQ